MPAVIGAAFLGGCASTSIQSTPASSSSPPSGFEYWLPTAPASAQLVYKPSRGFALRVAVLPTEKDLAFGPLYLAHVGSPIESDKVSFKAQDGLLTTVGITSESKLIDTVQGAGESIGTLVAAIEGSTTTADDVEPVVSVRFDPADESKVADATKYLEAGLHSFASKKRVMVALEAPLKPEDKSGEAERKLRDYILSAAATARVALTTTLSPGVPANATPPLNCSAGACYRQTRPASLTVAVDGVALATYGMNIPNGTPAIVFPLSRSGASNSSATLTLDRGVLSEAALTKDAQAPNIVRVPGTLVAGIIKGFTDTLTARKGALSANTELVKARTDAANADALLIDAKQQLVAKRAPASPLEASLDEAPSTDLWLPGLSFYRAPPADTTQPKVSQAAVTGAQPDGTTGTTTGSTTPRKPGDPTGTTSGSPPPTTH